MMDALALLGCLILGIPIVIALVGVAVTMLAGAFMFVLELFGDLKWRRR